MKLREKQSDKEPCEEWEGNTPPRLYAHVIPVTWLDQPIVFVLAEAMWAFRPNQPGRNQWKRSVLYQKRFFFSKISFIILRRTLFMSSSRGRIKRSSKVGAGSCLKRQKPQAPTPQAPIRNRQTREVANAKVLKRITNLTWPNLT